MKRALSVLSLFVCIAASCATAQTYYYNKALPRNNQQGQFAEDSSYCRKVAQGSAPMPQAQVTGGGPRYTNGVFFGTGAGGSYTGQYHSVTTQSGGFASGFAQGLAAGQASADAQDNTYVSCMASLGWEQVSKDYVPPQQETAHPQQSQDTKAQVAPQSSPEPAKTSPSELESANQRMRDCIHEIESKPAYQGVARHMPLNGNKSASLEQLTDPGIPSNEDIKTIISIQKDMVACREQYLDSLKKFGPSSIPVAMQAYHAVDLIKADLIQKKITWGEANKKITAVKDDYYSKIQGPKK